MSARNAFLFPQISFANKCLWVSYRDLLRKVNTWMKSCFCGCIVQIKTAFIYIWFRQSLRQTASVTGCFRGDVGSIRILEMDTLTRGMETHSSFPERVECAGIQGRSRTCANSMSRTLDWIHTTESTIPTLKKIIINSESIISIGIKGIDPPLIEITCVHELLCFSL